ncbi:MAG: glycosyltransferase family 4 protein [Chloroflexi bacterium]|nr:glycosyltransferase family 4 protein [Chloroflexota bacterium]
MATITLNRQAVSTAYAPLIMISDPLREGLPRPGTDTPRLDYLEIARLLDGDVVSAETGRSLGARFMRRLEQYTRLNFSEAFGVARELDSYTAVLSTSEKVAIPLAAMLAAKGQRVPHVVIAHRLSSRFKQALFSLWPLHRSFTHVVCLCRAQAEYAVREMGLPETAVTFIPDKVDHRFFRPPAAWIDGDYILAVGQERRDYHTLLQAVAGTGLKLVIVASSLWSENVALPENVAANVTVLHNISSQQLRTLYAKARLVVTPLFDVPYAAGVNAVLEAMAMGRPLIVTRTTGISDYVVDDVTGIYTPPQNSPALRRRILRLWPDAAYRRRLGLNARLAVEDGMNLDSYTRRITQLVLAASSM